MITVYSKDGCPYCDKIKGILKDYKVQHKVLNLDEDYSRDDIIRTLSSSLGKQIEKFTYPVVFDQSFYIGGCDDMMDYMLEKQMV